MIEIYTDGAYNLVLSQGGWGAVIVEDGQKRVFSGMVKKTTSNRMEITAALEGILHTQQGAESVVYTDSQYLFGCMSRGWQRRANRDLWEQLDEAVSQRKVRWQWIDRNVTNPFHQEAHTLATNLASQGERLQPVVSGEGQPEASVVGGLTHLDAWGRPCMVDVTQKPDTQREAVAKGVVRMRPSTFERLKTELRIILSGDYHRRLSVRSKDDYYIRSFLVEIDKVLDELEKMYLFKKEICEKIDSELSEIKSLLEKKEISEEELRGAVLSFHKKVAGLLEGDRTRR